MKVTLESLFESVVVEANEIELRKEETQVS